MSSIYVRNDRKLSTTNETSVELSPRVVLTARNSKDFSNSQNTIREVKPLKSSVSIESNESFLSSKHSLNNKRNGFANNQQKSIENQNDKLSKVDEEKEKKQKNERKLAGFWKQFAILSWKNLVLSRRNVCGLITEIVCPIFIIIILIVIRYFVDAFSYNDQANGLFNVIDIFPYSNTTNLLLYYPNNTFIKSIIDNAVTIIKTRKPNFNPTVQASTISDGTLLDTGTVSSLLALISFPNTYTSSFPNDIQYTIYTQENAKYQYHVDLTYVSKIDYMFSRAPEFYCTDTRFFTLYSVFNGYKQAIDQSIIGSVTGAFMNDATMVKIQQFNCQAYIRDEIKARFSFFPPIIIDIAFLFTALVTVGNIVVEKQTKMKEYLKLIGIRWYIIWLTWFLRSLIIYSILSILISSVGVVPVPPRQNNGTLYATRKIFQYTNFGVTFLTFFVYSIQVSMFTILISQIFSKPFIAKVVTILLWIGSAINFYDSLPYSSLKYIFCMFPNIGLTFSFQSINQYERSGKTFDYQQLYSNLFSDTLNLGSVLASMFGYTLLYIPIAWYIERILPGDYGVPLPFYFPFMPSYWKPVQKIKPTDSALQMQVQQFGFEKESQKTNASVCIQGITKDFRTAFTTKRVVNNMSLNFYENQVTGLLGHNGAGKTTTTFMLCGIIPPTSGTATILGYDIVTEMDSIRTSMGFCPQHDILYDELYVEEHLELIALIKGFPKIELKDEILRISTFVGLQNDLKTRSKSLSGGMKRRLSVAMAMIGDSKVIILDEPTSGLDPFNRRGLWELIRKYKENRTIILTTHFMEEADALSDRIAIMNHGEVKCCGSPIFLKNLYGSGYRLVASKDENYNEKDFLNLISNNVANYKIETNIAGEITIALPYDAVDKLATMLNQIENQKKTIGISSYGISSSTIEEVFLKVGRIDKNSDSVQEGREVTNLDCGENDLENAFRSEIVKNTGCRLWMQQIQALLLKRFLIFIRRYILAIITLFMPLVLEAIICGVIPSGTNLVNSITGRSTATGTYNVKISNYKPYTMPYSITGNVSTTTLENLFQLFYTDANRPGITLEKLTNDTISSYVLQKRKDDVKNLVGNYYTGMSFYLANSSVIKASGYYSTLAYHTSASILNEISNIILAYFNSNSLSKTITTYNSPIAANDTRSGSDFLDYLACIDSLPLSLLNFVNAIIIGFCISVLVVHIGREKVNGSKGLQMLSGTHFVIYWISNHIFDLMICLFNIASIVGMIKLVNTIRNDTSVETNAISEDTSIGFFFLFLLFSIFSWTTLAYIWTFLFKSEIIGFVVLAIILGLGAFLDIIWSFLELLVQTDATNNNSTNGSNLAKIIVAARWVFTILFPNVTVKRVMFDLKVRQNSFCISALNSLIKTEYKSDEPLYSINEPGIGIFFIICVFQFLIGNLILYLIEKRPTCYSKSKKDALKITDDLSVLSSLESDVGNEFKRIQESNLNEISKKEPLIVNDIVMEFKKKKEVFVAVNHLGFGVQQKECFGLLGLNGAGKTTTFKILTGEIDSTSGNAYINGYNINKNRFSARRNLGFCPQYDYLPEYLTVEQSLKLFAKLRGLESKLISPVVNDMIKVFKLNEFSNKLVQDLSGGNKRKVNTVIAFLGRPSVVILDEPTTGVDPAAKRYLWTVINKARDLGMTIVLTSHSMEECEALCTRLGIMVNGQFQCLGNIQHLKSKYGKGYSLVIKTRHDSNLQALIKRINDFLIKNIRGIQIKDQQQETIYYHIEVDNNNKLSLSELFALIEKNKLNFGIETYAVSQTTLEDVFLSFARLQRNEEDKNKKTNQFSDINENQTV